MTTRDYQMVAKVLFDTEVIDDARALALTREFAAAFEQENPHFDRDRFMLAAVGER